MTSRMLAFDTSASVTAVAVLDGDRVLAEDREPSAERHAETLLPRIDQCLVRADLELRDIDVFAVGIGPGSFTGVRVGVATAKGLALATGKPVRGVVSLAALARSGGGGLVAPILDAYKGEVFAAVYAVSDTETRLVLPPFHALPERAAEQLAALPELSSARVLGSGYRRYTERLQAVWRDRGPVSLDAALDEPRACDIAHEARRAMREEGASDLARLAPLYVRDSDAKLPKAPLQV